MSGVNKAIVIGNLGADPVVRHTQQGKAIANLRVATSESWKGQDGSKQENTTWHTVVCFGRTAEIAGQFLSKGSKVFVEGRMQHGTYTDKEGNERASFEIVAQNLQFLDSKSSGAGGGGGAPAPKQDSGSDFNDDIPF